MSPKCFWLLSNGRTVREITHEKMLKLWREKRSHKLLMVHPNGDFMVTKGKNTVWIPRRQLEQTWKGAKP